VFWRYAEPRVANSRVDGLYGLPREEFTSARNALVRELRSSGRKDEAEEVRALKKPSVSAWAVNQLARQHPQQVAELVKAGDGLRKAQRDVLAGKKGADVRAASRVQHELADGLVDAAREILETTGIRATQSTAQRISGTLRAASSEPAAAKLLRKGRLSEDVESVGFGPLLHVAPQRKGRSRPQRDRTRERAAAQKKRKREAVAQARGEATAARKAADQAERDAKRARERAEAAERRVASLER
jgi:hypothetical protein